MRYSFVGTQFTCPKTGEVKCLETEIHNVNAPFIPATKSDLPCGQDCDIEPCPGIERNNLLAKN